MPNDHRQPPQRAAALLPLLLALLLGGGCKDPPSPDTGPAPAPDLSPPNPDLAAPVPDLGPPPAYRTFPSAAAALAHLLKEERPRVLGLGEFHQKKGSADVPSAVSRFTRALLPALARRTGDLVLETWLASGTCGAEEKQVVQDVERVTERPAETEDELVTLIKRARKLGVRPRILKVGCAEYRKLLGAKGVDYPLLLTMIRTHLQRVAEQALDAQKRRPARAKRRPLVAIYGGALHNDLHPYEELRAFSYAEALSQRVKGRYLELDLFVPEYIEGEELVKNERWYAVFEAHASGKHALLIKRAERSYILIFPRQNKR